MDGLYQIVYAAQHSPCAWRLLAQLSGHGVPLYFDQWTRQPAAGVPSGYIIILSRAGLTDPVLTAELAALDSTRPMFIAALEAVPSAALPPALRQAAVFSFSDWHDERRLSAQAERLAKAIERQFGSPLTPLEPELRYLADRIALLESDRPLLEFMPIGDQPSPRCAADERYQPPGAILWGVNNRLQLRHDQPAVPTAAAIPAASLGETLAAVRRVCLTGERGVGKSAVMKRLLLDLARRRFGERAAGSPTPAAPLPILIDLAADPAADPAERTLSDRVVEQWRHWGLPGDPIAALASGTALLAIDGIDALGRNAAAHAAFLQDWCAQPAAPQYVIITCETGRTADLNPGLPLLECLPFDEAGAQRMLAAALPGDQAAALWNRLCDPAADLPKALWTHPAHLLSVIALYQADPAHELPSSLGKLYRRRWEHLWQSRTVALPVPKPELMQRLAALALGQIDADDPAALPRAVVRDRLGGDAAATAALDAALAIGLLETTPAGGVRFASRWLLAISAAHGFGVPAAIPRLRRPVVQPDGSRRTTRCDDLLRLAVGIAPQPELLVREIAEVDPLLAVETLRAGWRSSAGFSQILRTIGEGLMGLSLGQPPERSAAAQAAQHIGHPLDAVPLLSAARTSSWDDRAAALHALSLQPLRIPADLLTAVRAWNWQQHAETAAALRNLGDLAVPALLRLLHDADWEVQRGAAWALGTLGDPAAIVALVQRLTVPDPQVRLAVVQALAQFDEPALTHEFFHLLNDEIGYVRAAARAALRRYPHAVLERTLSARYVDDLSLTGRQEITRLLGIISTIDPAAAQTLLLHHLDHPEAGLRAAACTAAAETAFPAVVDKLISLLEDNAPVLLDGEAQTVATAAWDALQQIDLPAAQQYVKIRLRQRPSEREQRDEQEAQHDRWAQTQELLHRLNDPDPNQQRRALNNLDRYDDPRIVPYLVETAASDDPHISRLAVKGLGKYALTSAAQHGLAAALRRPHTIDLAADLLMRAGACSIPTLLDALTEADPVVVVMAIGALADLIQQGLVIGTALTEVEQALYVHADNPQTVPYSRENVGDHARAALDVLAQQRKNFESSGSSAPFAATDQTWEMPHTNLIPAAETADPEPADDFDSVDFDAPADDDTETAASVTGSAWPDLPDILALLASPNDEIRRNNYHKLKDGAKERADDDRATAEWVTTLIAALDTPHETVLRAVLTVFGRWTTPRAAPKAAALLQHPDPSIRTLALAALHACDEPALLRRTLPLLTDPDWHVRYSACDFVRQHADQLAAAALPYFDAILAAPDDQPMWSLVIRTLGRLPAINETALRLLLHHVDSPDLHVRTALIRAFDRLRHPAGEALIPYLDDHRAAAHVSTKDAETTIDYLAAKMLYHLNTPRSQAAVKRWYHLRQRGSSSSPGG